MTTPPIYPQQVATTTMMSTLKPLSRLLAAIALLGSFGSTQAYVIYDNLSAAQSGADPVVSYGPLANSFKTDGNGGSLKLVQLLLKSDSSQLPGSLQVSLMADNGTAPGSQLTALGSLSSAALSTTSFGAYGFALAGGYNLAANTTYWIGLSSADPVAVEWSWSSDLSSLGVAGQYSYNQALGVLANGDSGGYQMSVAVPEPGSLALVALSLGLMATVARRTRR